MQPWAHASSVAAATRAAIKRAVASIFGASAQYRTRLTPTTDGHYTLDIDVEDLVLARHHDTNEHAHNEDPTVNNILNDQNAPSAPANEPSTAPQPSSASPIRVTPSTTSAPKRARPESQAPPTKPKRQKRPQSTSAPHVPYQHEPGRETTDRSTLQPLATTHTDCRNPRAQRSHDRKQEGKALRAARAETYRAQAGLSAEDLPATSTWWMGRQFSRASAAALRAAHSCFESVWTHLNGITLVPYRGVATKFLDSSGRLLIYRSEVSKNVENLLPQFMKEVQMFVEACTSMGDNAIKGNRRGDHWFCIAGVDRNNKKIPSLSDWHRENWEAIKNAFRPGTAMNALNGLANDMLAEHFPGITNRYTDCKTFMEKRYSITPQFGLFWNWCLNAVTSNVKRVHCDPHVDAKNLALGICIVFVYGWFNHHEKAWLVIWEAGICLELPPGVFLLYPSSLFFHFNVDLKDVEIVATANGEPPTRDNSYALSHPATRPPEISEEDWEAGNGRGSVVWFNQASMFQTSETGYDTLKKARKAKQSGTADAEKWLGEDGAFTRF